MLSSVRNDIAVDVELLEKVVAEKSFKFIKRELVGYELLSCLLGKWPDVKRVFV